MYLSEVVQRAKVWITVSRKSAVFDPGLDKGPSVDGPHLKDKHGEKET